MENQEITQPQTQEIPAPVGAPTLKNKKGGANKWIFIFLGLLILGGAGIFFFAANDSSNPKPTETPSFGVLPVDDFTPAPAATATATPAPVDKEDITVQILNGTGIVGEAGFLQGKLKGLDYTDIEVGNADSTDYEDTTVTFSSDLSEGIQDELAKELKTIYKKVTTKTSSDPDYDVVIITGLREGQEEASPSATPAE